MNFIFKDDGTMIGFKDDKIYELTDLRDETYKHYYYITLGEYDRYKFFVSGNSKQQAINRLIDYLLKDNKGFFLLDIEDTGRLFKDGKERFNDGYHYLNKLYHGGTNIDEYLDPPVGIEKINNNKIYTIKEG